MSGKMILFDLDGTLWDSSENVARSWNIILNKHGAAPRNLTADDIRAVMGKTMAEIADIFKGMGFKDDDGTVFAECDMYENEYIAQNGGKLFDGVRETLEMLKKQGFLLSIVSNCQTGYIPAFLNSMGMAEYFCDYEEWGRTKLTKGGNIRLVMERNGISAENAVYVGDTMKDFEAAKSAGIPFIHAAYGFGRVENPAAVINSFRELPDVLK